MSRNKYGSKLKIDGSVITADELQAVDNITAGTVAASSFVKVDADKKIDTIDITALKIGGTAVGSTAAEIDTQCDVSANTETIAESGTVSVTKRFTKIVSTGAGAVTLAAPGAGMLGQVKVIEMTGGNHDITLALTNVSGGSAATTCTFTNTNEALVLVGGTNKWHVVAESGVVLS